MTEKIAEDIGNCVRKNIPYNNLPVHLKQMLQHNQRDYEKYVFNYSLKNQLRFRGNLASKVFRHEQRYYELLVQKSIANLCLFPYHLADIVTKGLRVTPFNYYLDVISQLLRNDKSYDTLPNFTAADCLRVLGIGRNEYLTLISDLKTHSSRTLIFASKPNPLEFLPRFPVFIRIEPWWRIEVGYVLEADIRYVSSAERSLIDDLIDFGSHEAGKCDYNVVHSLYRKGLIYLDVPISGEDRICIPPLRNFVMNRVSGDYFENLLYKIFLSADEHMSILELAQMLQIELDAVKQAVSLFCRLGFAQRKQPPAPQQQQPPPASSAHIDSLHDANAWHVSWLQYSKDLAETREPPQITPLNYNSFITSPDSPEQPLPQVRNSTMHENSPPHAQTHGDNSSIGGYLSSDGNNSDFSFANMPPPSPRSPQQEGEPNSEEHDLSSELDELSESTTKLSIREAPLTPTERSVEKTGKRVGFLFDSTLTAFLMMGNLSPGLKNHAVTMFEVGKLCEESMDTFLAELEKVSLLDAEGEGDVSRYFAHAIILRSTICSLRHLLPGGLDLLRLECLECLDQKTRDRVLDKKYKFIISATPLTATLSHLFSIPFFGQFHRSSDCSHMWTKLFYNHLSGYGPPSVFLCRGTVLRSLPRIFLGYGKLLVSVLHSDSYVLNSENFRNINDQLRNGCVLVQGYGIRTPGELRYEAFPFDRQDARQQRWATHRAVLKLVEQRVDLEHHCGYVTFLNTGVPDIGCEEYELAVHLRQPKSRAAAAVEASNRKSMPNGKRVPATTPAVPVPPAQELLSPSDGTELTSFARLAAAAAGGVGGGGGGSNSLKSPDEDHFAVSPQSSSPSNVYTSADCKELLASELAKCDADAAAAAASASSIKAELVSQSSVEIPITASPPSSNNNSTAADDDASGDVADPEGMTLDNNTEEWTLLDVNFGVPLFDVDCNTRICERIVRQLCHDENLAQLHEHASAMNETFQRFIKQCMHFDDETVIEGKVSRTLPHPRINLAFENGRICYWNGR